MHLLFVLPYANVIEGDTVGAEIAPNWKITHWWQVRGSYSFLHMDLKDKPGFTDVGGLLGSYMGSSPTRSGELPIAFQFAETFEFDQTYRYSSALPAQGVGVLQHRRCPPGMALRRRPEFSVVGQNLLRPSHSNLEGIPARWWGSREASTQRSRGEGDPQTAS